MNHEPPLYLLPHSLFYLKQLYNCRIVFLHKRNCMHYATYSKTYDLMSNKWYAFACDYACTCMYHVGICNDLVYVRRTIHVPCPTWSRMNLVISKAHFSKLLEQFYSMLLLHNTTVVRTSAIPLFSLWNECCSLSQIQNSSQQEKNEKWLSRAVTKEYSRWRICSQSIAI